LNDHGQTVCLNMIVKDEAHVIERCLASVRPIVDTWLIVDTGSTDGTQDAIREVMADLPGELVERPWSDFASNRTEALELARGRADYVFVIDADETVELDPGFRLPRLTAGAYIVEVSFDGCTYPRRQLVRDALEWRYTGVLHEYIECDEPHDEAEMPGIRTVPRHEGARAQDPHTYRRDALLLEEALIEDPDNARYVFYLAQSYRDAGDLEAALRQYRRRVEMAGWDEEAWFSLYHIAQLEERMQKPWAEVLESYLAAHEFHPDRAGPLFRIGLHYQRLRQHRLAHLFLARAMEIPLPRGDRLFVERPVYDYLLPVEYAVASFYVGDHEAAVATNNALLRDGRMPPEAASQVVTNRRYSLDVRHPREPGAPAGSLKVVLRACDPGPELEEAVESLLAQEGTDFEALVVDAGPQGDLVARLPADPRLRVIQREGLAAGSEDGALDDVVRSECEADDVVVPLPAGYRLASPRALGTIAGAFEDAGCRLVYAPHRMGDGRLALALPAASETEHEVDGPALAGESILCFRAAVHAEARAVAGSSPPDRAALWRAAGFGGTRFLDDALTAQSATPTFTTSAVLSTADPASANAGERPLVSCLMVTRDRLSLALRAMRCFADQTYQERELVVVSEGGEAYCSALERYADVHAIGRVRVVRAEPGQPLGALRNTSIDAAAGEVLCQWDDDDCSHPKRLTSQWEAMQREGAAASFLTDHLQYVESEGLMFWIDWTMGGRLTNEWRLFPGSVMMLRDEEFRYPEDGPHCRQGEDSVLVDHLNRTAPIALLPGMGHLYLYHYHGRNTFSREHHLHISTCAGATDDVRARADEIREAVEYYPVPKPIAVLGSEGPAFVVA
jgi:glycosyltransferase involved in cell wall biosynthesis